MHRDGCYEFGRAQRFAQIALENGRSFVDFSLANRDDRAHRAGLAQPRDECPRVDALNRAHAAFLEPVPQRPAATIVALMGAYELEDGTPRANTGGLADIGGG